MVFLISLGSTLNILIFVLLSFASTRLNTAGAV